MKAILSVLKTFIQHFVFIFPKNSMKNFCEILPRLSSMVSAGGKTRTSIPTLTSALTNVCELGFLVAGAASPKKVFTCQLCAKVLCSKASLKRHIADKHAERQEEYRCIICERVYCSRNSLMTHIYTYHKSRPGDIDIKFF